jgi:hypothetical protein
MRSCGIRLPWGWRISRRATGSGFERGTRDEWHRRSTCQQWSKSEFLHRRPRPKHATCPTGHTATAVTGLGPRGNESHGSRGSRFPWLRSCERNAALLFRLPRLWSGKRKPFELSQLPQLWPGEWKSLCLSQLPDLRPSRRIWTVKVLPVPGISEAQEVSRGRHGPASYRARGLLCFFRKRGDLGP